MPTTPDIKAEDYYKAAIRHNEKPTTLMTQPFVKPAGSRSGSECLRQRNCQSLQEVGFEVRQARLKTGAERHIKPVLIPCRYHPDKNPDNKAQAEENFKAGARFSYFLATRRQAGSLSFAAFAGHNRGLRSSPRPRQAKSLRSALDLDCAVTQISPEPESRSQTQVWQSWRVRWGRRAGRRCHEKIVFTARMTNHQCSKAGCPPDKLRAVQSAHSAVSVS